jgi:hypothetical protein
MSDIRWVCLSDTHFGAENSLLSHVPVGADEVDPATASPVLQALISCLRAVIGTNTGSRRPTLVLNGDILEMALAQDNVAAMVFDRFIDLAFNGAEPLFDDTLVYLPGNHDHHLWETARERQYSDYLRGVPPADRLCPPWHVTRLFDNPAFTKPKSELLTVLVQRRCGPTRTVEVVYPNFGLAADNGGRVVVFHHGHFVEPLYRLMSTLKAALFPSQLSGRDVWDWEADNFAWIDFFWSTLGRSGDAGADVGLVYDMLQDREAVAQLAGNAGMLAGNHLPVPPVARPVLSWLLRHVARHARPERAHADVLLTQSSEMGLVEYLTGPLLRQLIRERPGAQHSEVNFVFGHTHKPFELMRVFGGFSGPVSLHNTGGWVVDTETTAPLHGSAVVLVDEELRVSSLRMFNQASDRAAYRVALNSSDDEFSQRLASAVNFSSPPWSEFSEAVAVAVEERHQILPRIIRRGVSLTR